MATTYIEYDGTTTPAVDGINTDFTFPFPYLKIEDVRASINGVDETAFTINPATPTLLQFTAAPTAGTTVRIYRQTDPDATPATFFAGSSVRAKDLNDNFDQILFIMQERQNFLQDLQLGQLPTGGLGTAALQDDAVTAAKLRDDVSIDGNRAVTTDHIRDNAITTAKIAADNVTMDKLGSGALPTDITVASANIVDDTIVDADINSAAAIAYSKLSLTGSVVDADINANAEIAVSKLADGTARQLLQTDAAGTGVEWTSNVDVPGTLDVTGAATFNSTVNATGAATFNSTVNATGAATFNSTVTATGDVTVPSLNGGPLAGMRNLLINGNPIINQRGYVSGSATSGANQYTLDRWRVVVSGESLSWTDSNNVRTVTAPAGGVEQVIEGLNILSGTYTLSWTGTATATVDGSSVANGGQVTLTGGTNATVRFSSGTFSLAQLEVGSVATPFERRNYGQELALCQRYYETGHAYFFGYNPIVGSVLGYGVSFAVTKRIAPTVIATNISSGTYTNPTPVIQAVYTGMFTIYHHILTGGVNFYTDSWTASSEL